MDYPNLSQFFGCYFHQDWGLEAGSADEIISRYLAESPTTVRGVIDELDRLLALRLTEPELRSTLLELSCYYDPTPEGGTYSGWLRHVKELLSQQASKQ
jgi:hypothetical protein